MTDLGYPQLAIPIEIDSQAVQLVARDFSGRIQVFRHRRRRLSFIVSCSQKGMIKLALVPASEIVADALTKNYGPLTHWRQIANLLGECPELSRGREIVV